MPFLIDQLTLLHRQFKAMEQEQKEAIDHLELANDMQAIDEAFKNTFYTYEHADDGDIQSDTLDKHQSTECYVRKFT